MLLIIEYLSKITPDANIIYIDKEKYEFDSLRNYVDLVGFCNNKILQDKKNYIFIDEIQDITHFEKALRHYYSMENVDLYCTGSNSNLMSGELATFLSGRYIEVKVNSLSFSEFLDFHNLENNNESLKKYLKIGGLPYIMNLKDDENVIFEYLKNIFSTIIYKDIISRYKVRNPVFLENLIKYLANNTGNLISAKKISDYLKSQNIKMSPQLVIDYLNYTVNAFFITKVKRTDLIGKKVFESINKFYFEDIGLKNAIVGQERFQINQAIENVIYNHLIIAGYNVRVGVKEDKEIDFVCTKQGKKIYVQAAYLLSDKRIIEREYGNLEQVKDNYPKFVVSMDEMAMADIKGIRHFHLRDFLSSIIEFSL